MRGYVLLGSSVGFVSGASTNFVGLGSYSAVSSEYTIITVTFTFVLNFYEVSAFGLITESDSTWCVKK